MNLGGWLRPMPRPRGEGRAKARSMPRPRRLRPCSAALSAAFACSLRPRLRGAGALRFASLPPPRAAAGVRVRLLSAALRCSLRASFPSPCARRCSLHARSRARPSLLVGASEVGAASRSCALVQGRVWSALRVSDLFTIYVCEAGRFRLLNFARVPVKYYGVKFATLDM